MLKKVAELIFIFTVIIFFNFNISALAEESPQPKTWGEVESDPFLQRDNPETAKRDLIITIVLAVGLLVVLGFMLYKRKKGPAVEKPAPVPEVLEIEEEEKPILALEKNIKEAEFKTVEQIKGFADGKLERIYQDIQKKEGIVNADGLLDASNDEGIGNYIYNKHKSDFEIFASAISKDSDIYTITQEGVKEAAFSPEPVEAVNALITTLKNISEKLSE